ncbi:MAG: peptidase E [Oscillospiraceae bacterium]|nr:peptidase E [Oscillospiraceae bacterium]
MGDKKIVAVGGGENGRPGYPYETFEIDKRIAELAAKNNPKLLFIGTASSDSELYYETISKNFGQFGCITDNLTLTKTDYSQQELENKILSADIIYVGGGNTKMMLELWREKGVDKLLLKAYDRGVVLSGISAGSMCWFTYINPDLSIRGLGLINCAHRPHYGKDGRKEEVKEMMRNLDGWTAAALEDCTALEVINDKYRLIKSDKSKKGYKTYWHNGEYIEKEIMCEEKYGDLNELIHTENQR